MILKASVLIVLLCLIFGICFRYRYRLAEPVFVQQNTAVTAIFDDSEAKPGWYADVTFYYITGRGDDRLVQHIDFSQLQPAGNNAGDEASLKEFTETIESKGKYLLHTLGGKLFVPSGEPLENYRVVTEGNVYYTDGSSAVTELGNLIFEPDSRVNTVAEVVSVSSGSEGKSEMVVRMKSAAALKVKEVLTPERTSGSFHMRLNGIELAPGPDLGNKELMRFEKGDVFKMDSRWDGDSRFDDPSGLISTIMILELEGKARQTLLFVHSVLQPAGGNFINMWKYLNQRGVF